ncbi:MAG: NEW3 domain-containing protein [Candidatus Aenigmatarchaeota archaeon]
MEKTIIILASLLVVLILIFYIKPFITGLFIGFGQPTNATWFNTTWHYRFRIEVTPSFQVNDWPIEIKINFSDLIPYGTFDENSIRVFEYDENGNILYEVPSQFDKDDGYSESNALGELIFVLNGTTLENQKRIFYVYYDIVENGVKERKEYEIPFYYFVDSDKKQVNVNTSDLAFYIDTSRQNYSGIYAVVRKSDEIYIVNVDESQKPIEYTELYNGTDILTFDLRNNVSLIVGPVRLTLIQKGYEVESSSFQKTNELFLVKKYHFYNTHYIDGSYVRIQQLFYNLADYTIARSSTPAGAIAIDLNRSFEIDPNYIDCNEENPYSYCLAGTYAYGYAGGIINLNSTSNFYAKNETETLGRIGLHLNHTNIFSNSMIYSDSVIYFGAYGERGASEVFHTIRNSYISPIIINISNPEKIFVNVSTSTNATVFNRNEALLIKVNITEDPYRLAKYINATFDLGTLDKDDDITIVLYDDGTHGDEIPNDKVYTSIFIIPIDGNIGTWKVNISIYDKDYIYLDSSEYYFLVTDILNVNVSILNKILMEGRVNYAILTVSNFRNDSFVEGASIICSYGEYITTNYTDFNNGTYLVNFTNPPYGDYILTCNVSKDGNFGQGEDSFFSQAAKTQVEINTIPNYIELRNVSYYNNETFSFYVNASNIGKGIAYLANISFEIPENWEYPTESGECGDISIDSFCYKYFSITTDENILGVFNINVTITWRNPDDTISYNRTTITVNILPNPILRVEEKQIIGIVKDGLNISLGNITILSEGNYNLTNITFNCISPNCNEFSVSFNPQKIEILRPGEVFNPEIILFTPLGYQPGIHNITINVSSEETFDIFTITAIVEPKTNVSIELNPKFFVTQKISLYEGDSFSFSAMVTNIQNSSARNVILNIDFPANWSSNTSIEYCGNLRSGENCTKSFNINIPESTSPGIYQIRVYVNWTNLDNFISSNLSIFTVTVLSNPLINTLEKEVVNKIPPSQESYFGNLTVLSTGNDRLRNISFSCIGEYCNDFVLKFIPNNFDLDSGKNQSVSINITVPFNYLAGSYNLTINVSSSNSLNYSIVYLIVNISENRTWDLNPVECRKSEYPKEGIACIIEVNNLGNAPINFYVSPLEGNYTKIENSSFVVNPNSSFDLYVSYNVSEIPEGIYVSDFTVFAVEDNATPRNKSFRVILLPFTPPQILVYFDNDEIEQNSSIKIYANVTDRSTAGIKQVLLNVTQPNGISHQTEMNFSYSEDNIYVYYANYPFKDGGDTLQVGYYNATVYAEDNIGNYEFNYSLFKVRRSFMIFASTLSSVYYQGDVASIYFSAKDFEGKGLSGVEVLIRVFDPEDRMIYSSSFITNEEGLLTPLPTFQIASDAIVGNYTLSIVAKYTDSNVTTLKLYNSTFSVIKRAITVTGLFADISTAVVWYPNNIMKFGILIYDGEGKPVDPEYINLTVYDPAGNVYLSVDLNSMNKESTGFYSYKYAMPPTTPSGMFLAVVNASKGEFQTMKLASFRVAHGGPYDVKVIPLEYEVAQGDELDFNILIINMGEVSQDVFIEYWISSPDGRRYFSSSEAVYTPALSNKTFLRSAYIFLDQPLGLYYINVKVTYDYVQPPIIANATFLVVARNVTQVTRPIVEVPIPTGQIVVPTPLPIPTANLTSAILIERYPRNISVARNSIKAETIVVRNIGSLDLFNVTLILVGLPVAWFNITPSNYYKLEPNQTAVFVITFNIPNNANLGIFPATLIASSNLIADSKDISITIFRSIEDLLLEEISKLEEEYADLVIKTRIAEKEGKDVSVVKSLLEKVENELKSGRINLKEKRYEDAIKNVENAKIMIERIKDLLSKLEVVSKAFVVPFWLIVSSIGIIFAILTLTYIKVKKKEKVRLPVIISVSRLVEFARKKESRETLLKEREEVIRALKALERSRENKIISEEAYRAMKKSLEEKLARIEKKIK